MEGYGRVCWAWFLPLVHSLAQAQRSFYTTATVLILGEQRCTRPIPTLQEFRTQCLFLPFIPKLWTVLSKSIFWCRSSPSHLLPLSTVGSRQQYRGTRGRGFQRLIRTEAIFHWFLLTVNRLVTNKTLTQSSLTSLARQQPKLSHKMKVLFVPTYKSTKINI